MFKIFSTLCLVAGAVALAPSSFANGCNGGGWGGGNNNELRCDAGGPYVAAAQAPFVTVKLDGRDSRNETGYHWSTQYPGALFDDATSATPNLTIPVGADCSFEFSVRLTVKKPGDTKTCWATVRVRDCTPPVITCPEDGKVFCGESTSPNDLGRATATDNCDTNVKISYSDTIVPGDCAANRFDSVIRRRWRARDNDCNTSTCTQLIDVVKQVTALDIRPGVFPNGYDADACDLLPVTILGLDGFNVGNIQWNTVKMYTRNCDGGPVSPQCFSMGDVAGPFFGGMECSGAVVGPDGKLDLTAYFSRNKMNQRLGLDDLPAGTQVPLVITGRLCTGCKFIAEDCVLVL